MKAIILAAGRGSRMKNLTDENPKCLVKLHGRPLLEYQLGAIREAGIKDIAIVTGYKRELLMGYGLVEFHNSRWETTNMVTSLACAEEWLQSDTCLVTYSDIVYSSAAVVSLIKSKAALAIAFDPHWRKLWEKRFKDPLVDAETFRISPNSRILEIGKQPSSIEEVEGQYMGLLQFRPEGWSVLSRTRHGISPEARDKLDMTGALQKMIENDFEIFGVPINESWGEIDSESDLKALAEIRKN